MTYKEQLQKIAKDYRKAGMPWPAAARDIAAWAIDNNLWEPQRGTLISKCADEISDALGEEYYTDPQGRRVRTKHVARLPGEQMPLWDDIRSGNREHFKISTQQRRQQVVGELCQLKTDVDSFNENNNLGEAIQLILDLTYDVEERLALNSLSSIGSR
jgi:hypothetical protein